MNLVETMFPIHGGGMSLTISLTFPDFIGYITGSHNGESAADTYNQPLEEGVCQNDGL